MLPALISESKTILVVTNIIIKVVRSCRGSLEPVWLASSEGECARPATKKNEKLDAYTSKGVEIGFRSRVIDVTCKNHFRGPILHWQISIFVTPHSCATRIRENTDPGNENDFGTLNCIINLILLSSTSSSWVNCGPGMNLYFLCPSLWTIEGYRMNGASGCL